MLCQLSIPMQTEFLGFFRNNHVGLLIISLSVKVYDWNHFYSFCYLDFNETLHE